MPDGRTPGARRLEPHPPHRRRHRRRGRPAPRRRGHVPQRHRHRPRRPADPARRPVRQPRRAVPARRRLSDRDRRPTDRPTDRRRRRDRAAGVGPDRLHRLRRAARAHRAAARALRRATRDGSDAQEFEDAIAACNLLPGPASTQLAIFCAWRVRGRAGALVGGLAFIVPGLIVILALAALFLGRSPPLWVLGAGAGRGAAVAAVAVHAGAGLVPASWQRAPQRGSRLRWVAYLLAGAAAAATSARGSCSSCSPAASIELRSRDAGRRHGAAARPWPLPVLAAAGLGGGRAAVGRLGRAQGRRPVLRRRLRDHPADAGRRRRSLPLDDRRRSSSTRSRSARSPPARSCRPSPSSATPPPGSAAGCWPPRSRSRPSFAFILLGADRFDRLRGNPRVARLPRRRRPGRDRRHPRLGRSRSPGPHRTLAVRRPRRRRGPAARLRRGPVPTLARRRRRRRHHRPRRRVSPTLTQPGRPIRFATPPGPSHCGSFARPELRATTSTGAASIGATGRRSAGPRPGATVGRAHRPPCERPHLLPVHRGVERPWKGQRSTTANGRAKPISSGQWLCRPSQIKGASPAGPLPI